MAPRPRSPRISPAGTVISRKLIGAVFWLSPLEEHGLSRCPVVEDKRPTHDGEYRGALDVMLPQLRVAQNLMARVLDDVEFQVAAPVIMEGIDNPEDWGPHAILESDGSGTTKAEFVRQPINFEANQHIKEQLDSARRVGKFPQQRTGEAGASIVSAKGTQALMGSYNSEMAQAQRDSAHMLKARCMTLPCRNMAVMPRHHSPASTAGGLKT